MTLWKFWSSTRVPKDNNCANPGVVTDLETPWQNSVVKWQAPTMEAEVNELIDFTFAELNRRVGRA